MLDRNFIYQAASMLLTFVATPHIVNSFGSESFGIFGIIVTYATTISIISTLRSEVAFSACAFVDISQSEIFLACSKILLAITFITTVLASIANFLLSTDDFKALAYANWIIVTMAALGFFSILNFYTIRNHPSQYSVVQLFKNISFYSAAFILPSSSLHWLIGSFVLSIIISSLVILWGVIHRSDFRNPPRNNALQIRSLVSYSLPYMGGNLISLLRESLVQTFIIYEYGSSAAGIYYFALVYMVRPFQTYATIISNKLKYTSTHAPKNLISDINKWCLLSGALSIIFTAGLLLFRGALEQLGLDSDFALALIPMSISYLILMPITSLFEVYDLGKKSLLFSISLLAVTLLACLIGHALNLAPQSALILISLFFLASYLYQYIYLYEVCKKKLSD